MKESLNNHPTLERINEYISELKKCESTQKNPNVDTALAIINEIVTPYLPWFNQHGIVVTCHGSLQYHDPRNLDVDIQLVSANITFSQISQIICELESKFEECNNWPTPRCDPDFGLSDITDIKYELEKLDQNLVRGFYDNRVNNDDYYCSLSGSMILSSKPLYESQNALLSNYRAQVIELCIQNIYLREGIEYWLYETLEIRRKRRKNKFLQNLTSS